MAENKTYPGYNRYQGIMDGFAAAKPGEGDDGEGNTFDGIGHTHDMVVKSLLTLDQWT